MCAATAKLSSRILSHSGETTPNLRTSEGAREMDDFHGDSPELGDKVSTVLSFENDTILSGKITLVPVETLVGGSSPALHHSFAIDTRGEGQVTNPCRKYKVLHNCGFRLNVTFLDEEGGEHQRQFPIHYTGKRLHKITSSELVESSREEGVTAAVGSTAFAASTSTVPPMIISFGDLSKLRPFIDKTPEQVVAEHHFFEVDNVVGTIEDRFHFSSVCVVNDTEQAVTIGISSIEKYPPLFFPNLWGFGTVNVWRTKNRMLCSEGFPEIIVCSTTVMYVWSFNLKLQIIDMKRCSP